MPKNPNIIKQAKTKRRQLRARAKIFGTRERPRLNVTRSLNHLYLQLIDDSAGQTLLALHSKTGLSLKGDKTSVAKALGQEFAKRALEQKIDTCVFDRAGYPYHGRIKAVAEGLRAGGLQF